MPEIPEDIKDKILETIIPLGNKVYIYVLERASKIGVIEMPEQHAQRSEEAVVIATGKDVEELEVGDKILISYHMGTHIQLPDTYSKEPRHRIISEFEILTKI